MRGVIWYQGESIVGGSAGVELYPRVQAALIRDWRKLWGEGDFPFYIVQLAGQDAASNNPLVREAQATVLSLPNTGMAVTTDIGEATTCIQKINRTWATGWRASRWPMSMAGTSNFPARL